MGVVFLVAPYRKHLARSPWVSWLRWPGEKREGRLING